MSRRQWPAVRELVVTSEVSRLVIATRRSRLALWQAEHIKRAAAQRCTRARGRAAADVHARRRAARPPPRQGRRQGPVREGAGERDGRRPRRPRGAFDEGRAGRAAAGLRARRDHRARGSARRLRFLERTRLSPTCPKAPSSAPRACAAPRRCVERHPGLEVRLLRGNVETRLAKLDRGEYDAIVLAGGGARRASGSTARIRGASRAPTRACRRRARARSASNAWRTRADVRALLAPLADAGDRGLRARRARGEPRARRQLHAAARRLCGCSRRRQAPAARPGRLRRRPARRARSSKRDGARSRSARRRGGRGPAPPGRGRDPCVADMSLRGTRHRRHAAARRSPQRLRAPDRGGAAAARSSFPRSRSRLPPPAALPRPHDFDLAIFVSPTAVREAHAAACAAWPAALRAVAIGARHAARARAARRRPASSRRPRAPTARRCSRCPSCSRCAGKRVAHLPRRRRAGRCSATRCAARGARGRIRRVLSPRAAANRSGAAARGVAARRGARGHGVVGARASTTSFDAARRRAAAPRRRSSCRTRASPSARAAPRRARSRASPGPADDEMLERLVAYFR